MKMLLYFVVVLTATITGAATGMGGGVIIKPVLDMLGDYPVETIGALSSATILTMSLVSVGRHVKAKTKLIPELAISLSAGSVVGGYIGNFLISRLAQSYPDSQVKIVQNMVLSILLLLTFIYMLRKDKIETLHLEGPICGCLTGLALGAVSSFFGIGGGPINVAVITYVFSLSADIAAVYSLVTILFAQISKLGNIFLSNEIDMLLVPVLPAMLASAVMGGWLGSALNRRLPPRVFGLLFNGIQAIVFCLCWYNVFVNM